MRRSRFFLNSFLRFAGAAAPAAPALACLSGRVAWSGAAFCSFATFDSVSCSIKTAQHAAPLQRLKPGTAKAKTPRYSCENPNSYILLNWGAACCAPTKPPAKPPAKAKTVAAVLALLAGYLFLGCYCAATRAFAGTRVGVRALTAHRKIAAMANAAIGLDFDQAANVHLDLFAEIAFDAAFFFNFLAEAVGFVFRQVADLLFKIHVGFFRETLRARAADTIDGGEAHPEALLRRKIDTCDACHVFLLNLLSLALLVLRVGANYADYAAAMDDLAFVANRFDACSYFHGAPVLAPKRPPFFLCRSTQKAAATTAAELAGTKARPLQNQKRRSKPD